MATNLSLFNNADEDYIDMEVSTTSSSSNLFCYSPPNTREFEFQKMSSISGKGETTTTSPADELFYKGKLLPLHLPPRLQMVQKLLLQNTKQPFKEEEEEEENFITISTTPSTSTSTPVDQSCNISPLESCRVSFELNPDEYFFEWSTELRGFINGGTHHHHKKSCWSKKLKLMSKHSSSLTQKLKASRAYLKELFSKSSGCSDESSCAKAAININAEAAGKVSSRGDNYKVFLNKYMKVNTKKSPYGQIRNGMFMKSIEKEEGNEDIVVDSSHRRSFSGAIKLHHSKTKCSSSSSSSSGASSFSSSSFSLNSSGFYELQIFKRSSSASSELEGSIEAAIAHCKSSQYLYKSRNALNESGFHLQSVSKTCRDEDSKEAIRF